MLHRVPELVSKELPIERIFREVVGRKMTDPERLCFRLKPNGKPKVRRAALGATVDLER
jgi:hypothetical protein